jgi:vancomycin permeability regulator SanA
MTGIKLKNALTIWNYLNNSSEVTKSDLIWAIASYNTDVATLAINLFKDEFANYLLFVGGNGKANSHYFSEPEARYFANLAIQSGVPENKVFIDEISTNNGESILFSHKTIKSIFKKNTKVILLQKPYKLRSTYNFIISQYPEIDKINLIPHTYDISMEEYFDKYDEDKTLNAMIFEIYVLLNYPKKFSKLIVDEIIPETVIKAYKYFINKGYTKNIPK